jgi:acyl-CoA thioester hydrolase
MPHSPRQAQQKLTAHFARTLAVCKSGMVAPFLWQSRIRFVDTDASGRIHYSALFRHGEAAEFEFFRALGCPYLQDSGDPIAYPRVRVEADYLSAIRCDDVLSTEVRVERIGRSSYTLALEASVEGRPAARSKVTVVAMDRATGKATALPAKIAAALQDYVTACPSKAD